jgi:hypothetical protein
VRRVGGGDDVELLEAAMAAVSEGQLGLRGTTTTTTTTKLPLETSIR